MTAPRDELIKKLHTKGFCTAKGKPTTKLGWIHLDVDQIILLYNGINRGIQNYYRFADNFAHLARIQYILKFSLAHTLATKYKCGVAPSLQTLWQNPYHHHQNKRWKTRPLSRILQQQRLEKATQRLSNRSGDSRSAPMERQSAITLKIGNAMLRLSQFRASRNAPCSPYSQNWCEKTSRHQRHTPTVEPKTNSCLSPMPPENPSR